MKLVTESIIPANDGCAFELKSGQFLKVVDIYGQQVSDLYCFNSDDRSESLSSGRSIDYADTIFLTKDHDLYSNRSRKMLKIIEDGSGRHDFLLTPCSLAMFQLVAQNQNWHPSCHENLSESFAKYDISADMIGTTFNIFMNVPVAQNGSIKIEAPATGAGDAILFRAEMDLLVGLTACAHEGTNAGCCKPIKYQILEFP